MRQLKICIRHRAELLTMEADEADARLALAARPPLVYTLPDPWTGTPDPDAAQMLCQLAWIHQAHVSKLPFLDLVLTGREALSKYVPNLESSPDKLRDEWMHCARQAMLALVQEKQSSGT